VPGEFRERTSGYALRDGTADRGAGGTVRSAVARTARRVRPDPRRTRGASRVVPTFDQEVQQ